MDITPAVLAAINVGFSNIFQQGYQDAPIWWNEIMMEAPPSMSEEEVYGWLAKNPRMREWIGERVVNSLAKHAFAIKNKRYENTMGIERIKIMTDKLGMYKIPLLDLGASAKYWPQDLLVDLIENGHQRLCYDFQYFFDTDHPVDLYDATKGTQSNRMTGKPLNAANYAEARAKMYQFKGEDGKPMGIVGDLLLVPSDLEDTALKTVVARTIANGAENVQAGMSRVKVVAELTNNGANSPWYMFATKRPVKPFVHQVVRKPTPTWLMNESDPNVFHQDEYIWGVDAYGNSGYGPWFLGLRGEG